MQAETVLKALADGSRLKIVSYLMSGPKFVEQIARQLNISVSTASFHLEKLKAAGLVRDEKVQYYKSYSLSENALNVKLVELVSEIESDGHGFENEVILECFENGRLVKFPVQKMKRQVVLTEIAKKLTKKGGYTEREINVALADFYDDFITLKRELVSFGLVESKDGRYRSTMKKNNNI